MTLCSTCGIEPFFSNDSETVSRLLASHEIPDPEEEEVLRRDIEATHHQAERLDDQIKRLEEITRTLKRQRYLLNKYIDRREYLLSPVRQLPAELVVQIVLAAIPEEHRWLHVPSSPGMRHGALKYTQVCRRWREILYGTASIWTAIHVDSSRGLEHALASEIERTISMSCQAPLTVVMDLRLMETLTPSMRDRQVLLLDNQLSPHFTRCCSLDLSIRLHGVNPAFRTYKFPTLHSLSLRLEVFYHLTPYSAANLFGDCFKQSPLRDLLVDCTTFSSIADFEIPWRNLTSFTLNFLWSDHEASGIWRIFRQLSRLQTLTLYDDREIMDMDAISALPKISLPQLRNLTSSNLSPASGEGLSAFLITPRLETLTTRMGPSELSQLASLIVRSGTPAIKAISLTFIGDALPNDETMQNLLGLIHATTTGYFGGTLSWILRQLVATSETALGPGTSSPPRFIPSLSRLLLSPEGWPEDPDDIFEALCSLLKVRACQESGNLRWLHLMFSDEPNCRELLPTLSHRFLNLDDSDHMNLHNDFVLTMGKEQVRPEDWLDDMSPASVYTDFIWKAKDGAVLQKNGGIV